MRQYDVASASLDLTLDCGFQTLNSTKCPGLRELGLAHPRTTQEKPRELFCLLLKDQIYLTIKSRVNTKERLAQH